VANKSLAIHAPSDFLISAVTIALVFFASVIILLLTRMLLEVCDCDVLKKKIPMMKSSVRK